MWALHIFNDVRYTALNAHIAELMRRVKRGGHLLRVLFHSDGCRTRNWATRWVAGRKKRYDYPRWEFVNRSDDILDLCCWALDLCEIAWRRPRAHAIAVSRRDDVRRLDALIGSKS